jgi:pyruvate dehydrogenase E2 component (dihydrolipoamide acetyltransferase)
MSNEITMPKLSDTMEEGKILRWLKRPGDRVSHGDALAEVETDKADMILEAFDDGVLGEIKLQEGDSAPVGAVIALMSDDRGAAAQPAAAQIGQQPKTADLSPQGRDHQPQERESSDRLLSDKRTKPVELRAVERKGNGRKPMERGAEAPSKETRPEPELVARTPPGFQESSAPQANPGTTLRSEPADTQRVQRTAPIPHAKAEDGDAHKLKASPLARRAAEEAGIDLTQIKGSGPDGRITKQDIDNFLREQQLFRQRRIVAPREGSPGTREELSKMRRTIAQRMAASKREIPHYYVTAEIDMEEAVKLKKSFEVTELFDVVITFNDIVVKACALALGRYPRINASYEDNGVNIFPEINIGMAVAVEDGLIVPVIKGCERLSLPEIARVAHRLVAKAGQHTPFTAEELSGATFTISNMGMLGVEHFAAVIVPPQAAILAVSAIKDRPVVRGGQIVVGKTMMLTVSCDHRIIDGVIAGRFLQEVKRFLENPASLLV